YLNDPSQIRDAAVSEPMIKTVGTDNRYVVCLRYNARNTQGKYAGARDRLAVFLSGRFDRIVESAREQCKDVALAPFPELQRLTREIPRLREKPPNRRAGPRAPAVRRHEPRDPRLGQESFSPPGGGTHHNVSRLHVDVIDLVR